MKQKIKRVKVSRKQLEVIFLVILLVVCAIIVGIDRIEKSDFNPINGDFQNYNPVRRLLDGQIPFKDFAVYLGTGHLFILSAVQLIVGNNYTASLFVTNAMTMLFFELIVFCVSFFMIKDKRKALYVTLGLVLINLIRPKFIINLVDNVFINALNFGLEPGNSARLIRIAISPIISLIIYLGYKGFSHSKNKFIMEHQSLLGKIYVAFFAGITILWSNDGGIATYIAVSFVYFLLLIKEYKKDIKYIILYTFMYIGISLLSFFLILVMVTRGNILSWFDFTLGVSSYQGWYYGEAPSKLNMFIFQLDLSLYNIFMMMIAIYYIYKIFKSEKKSDIMRYALLDVCVIASILSTYLYQFISGGVSNDILNLVFWVWSVCFVIQMLSERIKDKKIYDVVKIGIVLIACGTIVNRLGTQIVNFKARSKYLYIDELGGYFSKLGDSVEYAMKRIENEKIFSTYASAIDVATNQYQPTGTDYIIHSMGDKQRKKYMETFRQGDFRYVTTTDRDYHIYRYWIKNANWFFYRELYQNYVPVFATEYNVFWEKSDKENKLITNESDAKITVNKKNGATYEITVKMADSKFNGVADVKLAYTSNKTRRFLKTGNINQYIYVNDITGQSITNLERVNYNIPNESDGYYVPITIVDGTGIIEVSSYPNPDTYLKINSAEMINVYDVNFKYCVLSKKHNIVENSLYIDNTGENQVILKGVKAIKIGKTKQNVISYEEEEEDYIKIEVDGNAKEFEYPNFFEVIK